MSALALGKSPSSCRSLTDSLVQQRWPMQSQYRGNPAGGIFLMKNQRVYLCINISSHCKPDLKSFLKRLPARLRLKHRSKLEDSMWSSKSRGRTILKHGRIPHLVSIPNFYSTLFIKALHAYRKVHKL